MIVAFSTSSPLASVALFREGQLVASGSKEARMNASGACLRLLSNLIAESESRITDIEAFLADLGPGSFTGLKVGVTLAKTMAMAGGVLAGGASAFDLISPDGIAVIPSRRGEFFWREGESIAVHSGLPSEYRGYGEGIGEPQFPLAANFLPLLDRIELVEPVALVPLYVLEPVISTPNRPFKVASGS